MQHIHLFEMLEIHIMVTIYNESISIRFAKWRDIHKISKHTLTV